MKKKILAFLCIIATFVLTVCPVFAIGTDPCPYVKDETNTLSSSEVNILTDRLKSISEKYHMQVAVVVLKTHSGDQNTFAENYYDRNGYGFGNTHDGVIFFISMGPRKWSISTQGRGTKAFTQAGREYMGEKLKKYLSKNQFNSAFTKFADYCEEYLEQYENGTPYDKGHLPFNTNKFLIFCGISLVIAFIISLICTGVMKSKLKSVRQQDTAKYYVRRGSLNIRNGYEQFLYRTVTRRKIESHSGGGGGGGSHSSGRSTGGSF